MVKKTEKSAFDTVRRSGLIAIRLKSGDELCWVQGSSGNSEVVLVSSQGQAIRFHEKDVRPMGRAAAGVRGMRLKGDDHIVGINMVVEGENKGLLLNISANGIGKFSPLKEYRKQGRGGSGIRTIKITGKTGPLVLARAISRELRENLDLILTSQEGQVIRTPLNILSILGRNTQGVRVIKLNGNDNVASGDVIME